MFQSSLPSKFWPYFILRATWMLNRIPSRVLDWKTPYEILFDVAPDLSILRPFGCLAFAVNGTPHRGKFAPRSHKCVILGYEQGYKGFLLYDLETYKLYSSRDVKFFPDVYLFSATAVPKLESNLHLVQITGGDDLEVD